MNGSPAKFKFVSLIIILVSGFVCPVSRADEKQINEQDYEREELGVNRYTTPPIAQIFERLDQLKPLAFDDLKRDLPQVGRGSREQIALNFGGLIADGFLIVACERKTLVDPLGRALLAQARSLGVGERVMRHSASLTELARRGDWQTVRKELAATQADVEQAMIDLRDQKVAQLIGLGGWLRGLEISSGAVFAQFSPERAKVIVQPALVDYFAGELKTLPPNVGRSPLFAKLREGIGNIRAAMQKESLREIEVKSIHDQARELNLAIGSN